jgi:RHS repeat-associated protein
LLKIIKDNNGTRLSKYVWDVNSGLPQVLTKSDANGTTIYDYGIDLISMTDPVKGQFYYHYDGLGSVRGMSDNSGGIKATYSYDAFGQPSLMSGSIDNDFLFAGEQMDKETGLIYLRARYYDPSIGMFITRDPFTGFASIPPSLNSYTYAYNNPVRFADPSGKVVPLIIFVASGTVNELF